jgi:hypothetical protein
LTRVSCADDNIEFLGVFFGEIFLARVDKISSAELTVSRLEHEMNLLCILFFVQRVTDRSNLCAHGFTK